MNNNMLAWEVLHRLRDRLPHGLTEEQMRLITMTTRDVMIERLAEGEAVGLDRLGVITPMVQTKSCYDFHARRTIVRRAVTFRFVPSSVLRELARANVERWGGLAGKI